MKMAMPVAAHHATDYRSAHDLTGHRSRARRCPERHAAENERKGSHQDRTQTKSAPSSAASTRAFLFVLLLGELNDKIRSCGQANEHHQPDLRVDIVFDLPM